MTFTQSIILGIIQGLSEFIPISSSGHLVLAPFLFDWTINPEELFIFDVLVQVATLLAVFVYFRHDLSNILRAILQGLRHNRPFEDPHARIGWFLILATIPAGMAFLLFNETFRLAFKSPMAAALFLLVTAALLTVSERKGKRDRKFENITWQDALTIGVFQILAIFPGISRSGATIAGGMFRGLDRSSSARFSFLISIPVMLAGGLVAVFELIKIPNFIELLPIFFVGFITAALVGYIAIHWLLRYLSKRPLYVFAIYCAIFGLINLGLLIR
ncbi:MAG: undecaprenyl-diphosphatase UppP [Chloroflexi bacterium]|nr:undecaprenyl-diphosphatase UppP [Chloroflexota bacterium]